MPFLSRVMNFWKNLFQRRQVERDLNDELMAYVEEVIDRHLRTGMTAEAAREAALLEAGGMDGLKEKVRRQHIGSSWFRRAAAAAALAVLFFAAGVGATLGYVHSQTPRSVAAPPASAQTDPPALDGILLLKNSRFPLPHVEVELRSRLFPNQTTTSDEWGRFTFTNPHPGSYRLVVDGTDVEIPLPSACGNSDPDLAPPASAAYAVYIGSKDGKIMEAHAAKLIDNGTVVAEARVVDGQRDVRVYRNSDGRLDIATMVGVPETRGVKDYREFRLFRYANGRLDGGLPWGRHSRNESTVIPLNR